MLKTLKSKLYRKSKTQGRYAQRKTRSFSVAFIAFVFVGFLVLRRRLRDIFPLSDFYLFHFLPLSYAVGTEDAFHPPWYLLFGFLSFISFGGYKGVYPLIVVSTRLFCLAITRIKCPLTARYCVKG